MSHDVPSNNERAVDALENIAECLGDTTADNQLETIAENTTEIARSLKTIADLLAKLVAAKGRG